jgi:hypothetical protein
LELSSFITAREPYLPKGVELATRAAVDFWDEVPIAVVCERHTRVACAPSDIRAVDPSRGEQRDPGVLQVVRTQRFELHPADGGSPHAGSANSPRSTVGSPAL